MIDRTNAAATMLGFEGEVIHPVVLVYFAGHGLQLGTEQYMVPYPEVPSPRPQSAAQAVRVTCDTFFHASCFFLSRLSNCSASLLYFQSDENRFNGS
jgi:hypothetical protein